MLFLILLFYLMEKFYNKFFDLELVIYVLFDEFVFFYIFVFYFILFFSII